MFNWLSDLFENVWNFIIVIIIIGCMACSFGIFSGKSNLEKFNSIDINLSAAGIDKGELQSQFKEDPLAKRIPVESHKRKRFMLVTQKHENAITEQFVEQMKSLYKRHKLNVFLLPIPYLHFHPNFVHLEKYFLITQ